MNTAIRTARSTGAAYLALAVFGGLGFQLVRPLAAESTGLAQLGLALELGVVIAQSLAAIGFWALFHRDRPVEAFAVAAFGMGNALAALGSAALLTAALGTGTDAAALLRTVADAFWTVGAVFFGLWLIPMGWYAIATRRLPRVLGWIPDAETSASGISTLSAVGVTIWVSAGERDPTRWNAPGRRTGIRDRRRPAATGTRSWPPWKGRRRCGAWSMPPAANTAASSCVA